MNIDQQSRAELKEHLKTHLKEHPNLLSQSNGRSVLTNYLVIDLRERHESMKFALDYVIGINQKKLEKENLIIHVKKDIEESNKILREIVECLHDNESRNNELNIQKLTDNIKEYTRILLYALPIFINAFERDIPEILDPLRKKNLKDKLDSTKHVLVDFTILDKLEFPESRAYLRELKEEIDKELEQERQSNE